MGDSGIPKKPDGTIDVELVREQFMASEFIDWTRFAEKQGWDPHRSRLDFPVRTWQDEKRRRLAEAQSDVIGNLIFERKFKWTRDIIDTLERYPKLIDKGSMLAEAKMNQMAEVYQDYVKWKKEGKHIKIVKNKKTGEDREIRVHHEWESFSIKDMSELMKGLRDVTEAKLKALMLDKWAGAKLDMPPDELDPTPQEEKIDHNPITIEGKSDFKFEDIQRWFDEFADKPELTDEEKMKLAQAHTQAPTEAPKPKQTQVKGVEILDDNGRPLKPNG